MKLSKLELELIQELRMAPISELEAAIKIFEKGLTTVMNDIGKNAIDNWEAICAGNINGILEEIVTERKSK